MTDRETIGVAALRPVDAGIPTSGSRAWLAPRTAKDGTRRRHNGIDMLAPGQRVKGEQVPDKVRSVSKGIVTYAGVARVGFRGYGPRVVAVKGDDGKWLLYAHLGTIDVQAGDSVTIGTKLGTVDLRIGHLHFEVSPRRYPQRQEQDRLDPVSFLSGGQSESTNVFPPPKPDKDASKPQGGDGRRAPLWGAFIPVLASLLALALKVMLTRKATR